MHVGGPQRSSAIADSTGAQYAVQATLAGWAGNPLPLCLSVPHTNHPTKQHKCVAASIHPSPHRQSVTSICTYLISGRQVGSQPFKPNPSTRSTTGPYIRTGLASHTHSKRAGQGRQKAVAGKEGRAGRGELLELDGHPGQQDNTKIVSLSAVFSLSEGQILCEQAKCGGRQGGSNESKVRS